MKSIMLSGPDGTGKSTIIEATRKALDHEKIESKVIWLRFHHYLAKIVNGIGRLTGKSFYEKYSWGKVGYHNYNGAIGYLYIYAVFIDHIVFRIFKRPIVLKNHENITYLIDRYILDIAADLIVDTKKEKIIFKLFGKLIKKELKYSNTFILECPKELVISRRVDIIDDKKYDDKIYAYNLIAEKFNVTKLNTGKYSVDKIVTIITNK
mgnify:CR=1 FL=1|tara:strand:- start:11823 stop:12446 length:624 start_codon:yes stop_codon:yes gene_type:complete